MPKIQMVTGIIKNCSVEKLEDVELIEGIIGQAAKLMDLTLLKTVSHKFTPRGLTSVALLAESHIAVHTYPEEGAIFLDVMSCGKRDAKMVGINRIKPTAPKAKGLSVKSRICQGMAQTSTWLAIQAKAIPIQKMAN